MVFFLEIDLIPAVATFLSCLFIRLELGIVIGIAINVIFLLHASARPSIRADKVTVSLIELKRMTYHDYNKNGVDFQSRDGFTFLRIIPDRSLRFPSVEYVRKCILKAGIRLGSNNIPIVIDARHIQGADFTAAEVSNFHINPKNSAD